MNIQQILNGLTEAANKVWNEAVHNRIPLVYGRDGYIYKVCPIKEVGDENT